MSSAHELCCFYADASILGQPRAADLYPAQADEGQQHYSSVTRVCRALVRSQALQARARLLAQAVRWLAARPARARDESLEAAMTVASQLELILGNSSELTGALVAGSQARRGPLCALVDAAVLRSRILEHVYSAVLRFYAWFSEAAAVELPGGVLHAPVLEYMRTSVCSALLLLPYACDMYRERQRALPEGEAGQEACPLALQYFLAANLMQWVAEADGGPSQGLVRPGMLALLREAHTFHVQSGVLAAGSTSRSPAWSLLEGLGNVWTARYFAALARRRHAAAAPGEALPAPRSPPPVFSVARCFDVLARTVMAVSLAARSAQARGPGSQQQGQQQGHQGLGPAGAERVSVSVPEPAVLGLAMLRAHEALEALPAGRQRESRLPAFWRALCAALRLAASVSLETQTITMLSVARARLKGEGGAVAGQPPAAGRGSSASEVAVAARKREVPVAVREGLLRALTGAMRAGGSAAEKPESVFGAANEAHAAKVGQASKCGILVFELWPDMLEVCAPALELAEALVVMRKMLASEAYCDPERVMRLPSEGGSFVLNAGMLLDARLFSMLVSALRGSGPAGHAQGAQQHAHAHMQQQGGGEGGQQQQQAGPEQAVGAAERLGERAPQVMTTFTVLQLLPTLMQYAVQQLQSTRHPLRAAEHAELALRYVALPCRIVAQQALMLLHQASGPAQQGGPSGTVAEPAPGASSSTGGGGASTAHASAAASEAQAWVRFMRHTLRMADVAVAVVRYIAHGLTYKTFGPASAASPLAQMPREMQGAYWRCTTAMAEDAATLLALAEAVEPGTFRRLLAEDIMDYGKAGQPAKWVFLHVAILMVYHSIGQRFTPIGAAMAREVALLNVAEDELLAGSEHIPQQPAANLTPFGKAWNEESIISSVVHRQHGMRVGPEGAALLQRRFLASPAEGAALLPAGVCANPLCTVLARDSEQDVVAELKACGRCRGPRYCCRRCQATHWRIGHKQDCVEAAAPAALQ